MAEKYLSQSSEVLLQCMSIAFQHNITDVLAPASLEMVECFQQFDPLSTSQFLALYQVMQLMCCDSFQYKKGLLSYMNKNVCSYSLKIGHTKHNVHIHIRTSK